ncbi:O-methyltransferase, family 2 [Niveomyces insectorum RCEF 264]|uniref:O-methyltransferase, family 2 n=1 Tax=Niveomyces insectorum RCEF 264 TaxID=1081102 RepID=A0A167YTV7_9HYPO|nr:O-methyltransferase, family 2 [Niveomyces insectorum RCEF 264]
MAQRAPDARARLGEAYHRVGEHCVPVIEFTLAKVFIDYKAWDAIPDQGDVAVSELAEKTGGTQEVLDRITTFFVSTGLLTSPSPGRVAHTERSRSFRAGEPVAGVYTHMFNTLLRPMAQLPDFFAKEGFASPRDNKVTPFGWAFGVYDKPAHEILLANATVRDGFTQAMREIGPMYTLRGIYDMSWAKEGIQPQRPVFVDVGGSHGLALKDILALNPFVSPEQVVLFDLAGVIENTKKNILPRDATLQKVQIRTGNMFDPYPAEVHGAQVYHIRRVLNAYPDDEVVRALQNVCKVAAPDTRLLIVEELLSPQRYVLNVLVDIYFMCAAGKRRSAEQFTELAERAGFRLSGQYDNINSSWDDFSVLEYVVA